MGLFSFVSSCVSSIGSAISSAVGSIGSAVSSFAKNFAPTIGSIEAGAPGTSDDNVNEGSSLVYSVSVTGGAALSVSRLSNPVSALKSFCPSTWALAAKRISIRPSA